jgi:hypothetical protein
MTLLDFKFYYLNMTRQHNIIGPKTYAIGGQSLSIPAKKTFYICFVSAPWYPQYSVRYFVGHKPISEVHDYMSHSITLHSGRNTNEMAKRKIVIVILCFHIITAVVWLRKGWREETVVIIQIFASLLNPFLSLCKDRHYQSNV